MKTLSPQFLAALTSQVVTLAYCWRIKRADGLVQGFTTHTSNFAIDSVVYKANASFLPSASASTNTLDVDNLEAVGLFDDEGITERDLIAGLYDYAEVIVFLVDYRALPSSLTASPPSYLILASGYLGEVSNDGRQFSAEVRGLSQLLTQKKTEVTSKLCRHNFGDSRCQVNLAPYTHTLVVGTTDGSREITVPSFNQPQNYFANGILTWTTGENSGIPCQTASWDATLHKIELFERTPFPILAGDTFVAIAGCRKTRFACKSYNNIINFGGQPDIPTDAYPI